MTRIPADTIAAEVESDLIMNPGARPRLHNRKLPALVHDTVDKDPVAMRAEQVQRTAQRARRLRERRTRA